MWTLWLITFASVVGQGAAPAVVTPLATYQSQPECKTAITQALGSITETYGSKNPPSPGVMFCVPGTLAKRTSS
jgi:hypothetical protein